MGKKKIIPAVVLLAFMCSCQDAMQPDVPETWSPSTISVRVRRDEPESKVGYDAVGGTRQMFWHKGDKIQFANLSNLANIDACLAAENEGGTTAFSGQITTWLGKSDVVAVYPHMSGIFNSDGSVPSADGGPLHLNDAESGEITADHIFVRLTNQDGENVSVEPGNKVTNGIYVALARDAVAESQETYSIPGLQFHQVTALVDANFTGFQKPVDDVNFYSDEDVFPVGMYVNPQTGVQNCAPGDAPESYLRSSLAYSVIRNKGETGNRMYLPLLPADLTGKPLEIWVAQGNQDNFGEDVQLFQFTKNGRVFERNKVYSMTLDAGNATTEPLPQITDATVSSSGRAINFSYTLPMGVSWIMAMLSTSTDSDGSGVCKLVEPSDMVMEEVDGKLVTSGTFQDVDYGSYYLYGYTSGDYYVKWTNQRYLHTNSSVAVPTVTIILLRDMGSYINASAISYSSSPVFERGFCYNTTGNPTIDDDVVVDDASLLQDVLRCNIRVPQGVKYYVRAYAINEGGVGYSSEKTITL